MTDLSCTEAQEQILDARRGRLGSAETESVRAHLASCAACQNADAADAELTNVLARLPRYAAPDALRRKLEARVKPARRTPWVRVGQIAAGLAVAASVAATTTLVLRTQDREGGMFNEAVNDHLRVLYSEHPVEIESGGIHQVKPWFAGKVDFAPAIPFGGDQDFPLHGGSVAYFMDRKAAAFMFSRRLHSITLFVFRADGLPWPMQGGEALGSRRAFFQTPRGFRVLLWRDGDLGYALVSDVNPTDLRELAKRIAGP